MTFLEWLADELKKTDSEQIEIGFEDNTTLGKMIGEEIPQEHRS